MAEKPKKESRSVTPVNALRKKKNWRESTPYDARVNRNAWRSCEAIVCSYSVAHDPCHRFGRTCGSFARRPVRKKTTNEPDTAAAMIRSRLMEGGSISSIILGTPSMSNRIKN
jgi:hypothetical protein